MYQKMVVTRIDIALTELRRNDLASCINAGGKAGDNVGGLDAKLHPFSLQLPRMGWLDGWL